MAAQHAGKSDGRAAGSLTFLFTDIEGSTQLWERHRDAMTAALAQHDALLRTAITDAGGQVLKTTGDGAVAVFDAPSAAIEAAVAGQRSLQAATWSDTGPLRVRMGIHCGPAIERDGDYFGPTLNRAARIMALGHGGQVLASEAVALMVRDEPSEGTRLRDLGEHRLRDLTHIERVHQVEIEGFSESFPPLRSLDAYRSNLPFQITSFVGRERELAELTGLVQRARLVTLTGVGGVGKTRLAYRAAAELLPEVHDGVWLCELAIAEHDDAVDDIVAQALSVLPRSGMTLAEAIVETLRDQACILVFDNCEHVLDPAAELAETVLQQCRNVRIIATSREGLGVAGEHLLPLRSLASPEPESANPTAVLSSDATALFVERAHAVNPDLRVDDANAAAIAEICRRLDGIPLAIELAAARTASLQPSEIAALLDERFRLLTGSRRRAVERHQTLRATVDWSYSLLSERDRAVFDRLGVFSATFDSNAARKIASDDNTDEFDVLDALDELVAKSMLNTEVMPDGTTRYQLLETLRQYAAEQLERAGIAEHYRRRHAEHYARISNEIGSALHGPDELAARAVLRAETDNLRAAFEWAMDEGDPDLVVSIVRPLADEAGWNRGLGIGAWAARAIALEPPQSGPEWAWVRISAGFHHFQATGEIELAFEAATSVLARTDLPTEVAVWACQLRAISTMALGDLDAALAQLQADHARYANDPGANAMSLVAVYTILLGVSGRVDEALVTADTALAMAESIGGVSARSLAHFARGLVLGPVDPVRARSDLTEALRLVDLGGADNVSDRSLHILTMLEWRTDDLPAATATAVRALEHSFRIGDYSQVANHLALVVVLLGAHGRDVPVLAIDCALRSGAYPPNISVSLHADIEEARAEYVAAAEQALPADEADAARRAGAAMSRDEVARYAIAELRAIAEPVRKTSI